MRRSIALLTAVVVLALVGANMPASADPEPSEFPYGVGASDVRPTSALLWTRTTASDVDLLVTTDYRSVLSEVIVSRFDASPAEIFPGMTPVPVGVMAGV